MTAQIEEIKTNEFKEPTLEDQVEKAKSERNWDVLRTIGGIVVPVVWTGAVALLSMAFESKDLRALVAMGAGLTTGLSGALGDYLEWMREVIDDLRISYSRVGYLKRHAEYEGEQNETSMLGF